MDKISKIKRRIANSKDGKIVFTNFGYLSLLQIAGYVFPLITMPYLARVIGADGFGKIAFASAIVVWIQTISDWGFNLTATRDVAQSRNDKDKVSHIFSIYVISPNHVIHPSNSHLPLSKLIIVPTTCAVSFGGVAAVTYPV